jgi:hypothetical protein
MKFSRVTALTGHVICAVLFLAIPTFSQTYRVLYSFTGGADGGAPLFAQLSPDAEGNLYGTTTAGGTNVSFTAFPYAFQGDLFYVDAPYAFFLPGFYIP